MTKRLILMRHAKSGWDDPLLKDHDRPLNARGYQSAKALGAWLKEKNYLPDSALSSSAVRTKETFEGLDMPVPVMFISDLYLASAGRMWTSLKASLDDTILMIGHNPGIAELAENVLASPPDHNRFPFYPTGATLVCDFAINEWAEAVPRSAHVVDFVVPRDLID